MTPKNRFLTKGDQVTMAVCCCHRWPADSFRSCCWTLLRGSGPGCRLWLHVWQCRVTGTASSGLPAVVKQAALIIMPALMRHSCRIDGR